MSKAFSLKESRVIEVHDDYCVIEEHYAPDPDGPLVVFGDDSVGWVIERVLYPTASPFPRVGQPTNN